ncbi:hypothetical protein HD806DRAFT_418942 [Xylariaceae sp. AK1471]|nr:hypothetical protein HD806DRAFT_418942 [Xylariaceae sp. AK1471]
MDLQSTIALIDNIWTFVRIIKLNTYVAVSLDEDLSSLQKALSIAHEALQYTYTFQKRDHTEDGEYLGQLHEAVKDARKIVEDLAETLEQGVSKCSVLGGDFALQTLLENVRAFRTSILVVKLKIEFLTSLIHTRLHQNQQVATRKKLFDLLDVPPRRLPNTNGPAAENVEDILDSLPTPSHCWISTHNDSNIWVQGRDFFESIRWRYLEKQNMDPRSRSIMILDVVSGITSGASAWIMRLYDRSFARQQPTEVYSHLAFPDLLPTLGSIGTSQRSVTRLRDGPSPAVFVVAVLVFTTCISTIYHSHRHDEHMNHWLAISAVGALVVGVFMGLDVQAIMVEIIPGFVVISLLVSVLFHRWFPTGSAQAGPMSGLDEKVSEASAPSTATYTDEKDVV